MSKLIPNVSERKKLFYHLKKLSSYTAWNRILGYYQEWAKLFEEIVQQCEDTPNTPEGAYPGTNEMIRVLKGLSTMEKCVDKIRSGDKSPFRYDGLICMEVADRPLDVWGPGFAKGEQENYRAQVIPRWSELSEALRKTGAPWGECEAILNTSDPTDDAPFKFHENYRDYFFNNKVYKYDLGDILPYHFPPNLPEVPDPVDNVLVGYGQHVPCSGIYEPVNVPAPTKGLKSLFTKKEAITGPFEIVGSMNYLHGGGTAPHIGEGREPIPTTWRLLWEDTRYSDGTIPEEEQGYIFNEPREQKVAAPIQSSNLLYAKSGERASKAGTWSVQEDLQAKQRFAAGDKLPLHQGKEVTWVWAG